MTKHITLCSSFMSLQIACNQLVLRGAWHFGNKICELHVPNCYKEYDIVEMRFVNKNMDRDHFVLRRGFWFCGSNCHLTTYVTPNWRLDWRDKQLVSHSQFLLSLLWNYGISWGSDMYALRYGKTLFPPDLLRCFCAERDNFVLRFHLHIPPHLEHIFFSECCNMSHMGHGWILLSQLQS